MTVRPAKTQISLGAQSLCWFCRVAAQILSFVRCLFWFKCCFQRFFSHIMMVSGYDKELNAHFNSAALGKRLMHQSFVTPAPMGLSAKFWSQHHPRSAVEWQDFWFYWFHAQTGWSNFTLNCRDLSRALTIRLSLQCWAYSRALQREKSISLLIPGP